MVFDPIHRFYHGIAGAAQVWCDFSFHFSQTAWSL
jgi:hypothetical protein